MCNSSTSRTLKPIRKLRNFYFGGISCRTKVSLIYINWWFYKIFYSKKFCESWFFYIFCSFIFPAIKTFYNYGYRSAVPCSKVNNTSCSRGSYKCTSPKFNYAHLLLKYGLVSTKETASTFLTFVKA